MYVSYPHVDDVDEINFSTHNEPRFTFLRVEARKFQVSLKLLNFLSIYIFPLLSEFFVFSFHKKITEKETR